MPLHVKNLSTPIGQTAISTHIEYTASPTVVQFMQSDAFARFLLGPVGSGKTTGVLFEVLRRCFEQHPGKDGLRKTRWAIVRNTLNQLKQTVLRDAESWLGRIMTFRPSENLIVINAGEVYSEWFLIPLADPEDKGRLLSMQLTGIWINEFIEIDSALLSDMGARCGRYPFPEDGGAKWSGIVGDSNMPNIGSDWHRILELERPSTYAVFRQPGGFDENAENLDNLAQTPQSLAYPPGSPERRKQGLEYYKRISEGRPQGWLKRYVHAEYGDDPEGTAVFGDTFSINFHVTTKEKALATPGIRQEQRELIEEHGATRPIPNKILFVAQDFGRNPCSLLWQIGHGGQVTVLDELVAENTALETHIRTQLIPLLHENRYVGLPVMVIGDPSGMAAGVTTEDSCFDVLARHGLPAQPAPTNELAPRLRAVERLLTGNMGGKPMLLIDGDRCKMLVRALNGYYKFGKTKTGATKPTPEKLHPWSDLADCLQYASLCATGGFETIAMRGLTRSSKIRQGWGAGSPFISGRIGLRDVNEAMAGARGDRKISHKAWT